MESITFNAVGRYKRETFNGRSYLVVPMTSIVPGVLPGSKGPLYYPPSEISQNVSSWDDMPLTMYHPTNRMGAPAPAKHDAHTIVKHRIGRVRNSVFDGKLKHEAWFNESKTRNADKRWGTNVYDRIISGRPIELSTGLGTTNVQAPPGYKDHRGERYDGLIATNYAPDHIAVLPNQTGACSLRDGCGVGVTNTKYTFDAEDCPKCKTPMEGDPDSGKCNHCGHKWGKKMTTNELTEKRSFLSKLAGWLGVTNDQSRHPKDGRYQSTAHAGAKAGFADTRVVESEFDPEDDDDEIEDANTDAPTKNESGKCKCGAVLENEKDTCVNCMSGGKTTNSEEADMALTAEAKKAHVDFLVTNCDCWKGEHNRKILNSLPDDNLVKLKKQTESATENALVINSLREDLDADLNIVATNAIPAFIKKKMDAKKSVDDKGAGDEDDSEVVDNDGANNPSFQSVKNRKKEKVVTNEETKPLTERLTPTELAVWNVAVDIERREREGLTANLKQIAEKADPELKAWINNKLKTKMDVAALRDMLVPLRGSGVTNAKSVPQIYPSYLGAAGGPDSVTRNDSGAGDDVLNTLTMDDIDAEERERKSA